ncbi:SunS family peptide S-glycosyltransferase [Bacillus cereus]|nr:SunS family peptide S-glycosyltransferase [Bacillus cereus]KMQ22136.1 hypothetical protein TU58_30225 [Bacillus cereus]PEW59898.1 SunS family peptide S-glycosyltransferase [Bacillus cereus]
MVETLNDLVTRLEHSHPHSSLLKDLSLIQGNEQYNYINWVGLSNSQNLNELVFQYEKAPYPSITCGILTYNEERCIKRCLDSLGNQFDEILVLDSHSTDNTTKIINRYFPMVKVVYEPWIDDFSFHRNKLISLTSSEWIYYIDADNYCVDSTNKFKRVAKLIQFLSIDCIISPMIKEHIGHVYTDNRKMFSVKKGIQFKGKVHEEPINADGSIPQNITVDIMIRHDGYDPEVINLSEKNDRNIKLTRQMMEDEPSNPKWLYFYAKELHYANEDMHIIETNLIKAIDLYKQSTYKRYQAEAILLLCNILFQKRQIRKLNEYLDLLEELQPLCSDVNYYRSLILFYDIRLKTGKLLDALKLSELENNKYSFIDSSKDHIKALLIELYCSIDDWEGAFTLFDELQSTEARNKFLRTVKTITTHINKKI